MFVVPRTTNSTQTTDTRTTLLRTRSAAESRQRGSAPIAFPSIAEAGMGRATDTTSARANSSKIVTGTSTDEKLPVQAQAATAVKLEASGAGMQKLLDTMNTLGLATSGLNISYSEEVIGYPGGSYTNKFIQVSSGGKTEKFSGDLTEKNPFVTAYEIQRYFNVGTITNGANGSSRLG